MTIGSPTLYRRERKISKPLEQDGLVSRKIVKGEIAAMVNEYETDHDIICNIGSCGTRHKNGWTAQLTDGGLALIGHICQKKVISDDEFLVLHRDFLSTLKNQRIREILDRDTFAPDELLEKVESGWTDAARAVWQGIRALRQLGPRHDGLMSAIQRNDGMLNKVETVKDTVKIAEVMARRHESDKRGEPNITMEVATLVHRIKGAGFLTSSLLVQDLVRNAKFMLKEAIEALESDYPTEKELEGAVGQCLEAGETLRAAASQFIAYNDFRAQTNLAGIAQWLNIEHHIEAQAPSDGLLTIPGSGYAAVETVEIRLAPATGWSIDDLATVKR